MTVAPLSDFTIVSLDSCSSLHTMSVHVHSYLGDFFAEEIPIQTSHLLLGKWNETLCVYWLWIVVMREILIVCFFSLEFIVVNIYLIRI